MESLKSGAEVLLRRERGGGFLFHPIDATFVHLDSRGFETVVEALHRQQKAADAASQVFIQAVCEALPGEIRATRLVELPSVDEETLGHFLSAPSLMDFQITASCNQACPQCYASSRPNGSHVAWTDARRAFLEMREVGVCQVAIGGGEPLRHPRLQDLLALVRDLGMVPNVTTTGIDMTASQRQALARHCGAVALSLEGVGERFALRRRQGFAVFEKQVKILLDAGINLVLQITLSAGNIDELPAIIDYVRDVEPLYGVIFLAHKPVGRAVRFDEPLSAQPFAAVYRRIHDAVEALRPHTRVGFDCCLTPLLAAIVQDLGFAPDAILEGCSGARGSLGLTPDLDVVPCTFLPHEKLGNLRDASLLEIWQGESARRFRRHLGAFASRDSRCADCQVSGVCLGGCPIWKLVGCRYLEGYGYEE